MSHGMIDRILSVKLQERSVMAFAGKIGMNQPTVDRILKGERAISLQIIEAILGSYPEISAEWLLRGEGSMIKASTTEHHNYEINYGNKVTGNNNVTGNSAPVYTGENCTIQSDPSRIEELQQENDRLNTEINKLREENRTLAMSNAALTAKLLPLI